jgi:hypothetical protein
MSNPTNNHVYIDESEINKIKSFPLLSKTTNLLINSGNIVSSNRIKKKISNDEIYECIQSSLVNWLQNSQVNLFFNLNLKNIKI